MVRAQRICDIPADPHQNDLFGEMGPFETDCHCRLPRDAPLLTGEDHTSNRFKEKLRHNRQKAFLTGLAHLYNLVPYQRRAQHAGQCGVEVEGGTVPTRDWFLNVQILTSGGFR